MVQIIFIKTTKLEELKTKLKEINFKVIEGSYEIGGCIDLENRLIFPSNVTCMCGFSRGKNRPLFDQEVINYFSELILNKDMKMLKKLYDKAKKILLDLLEHSLV